MNIGTEVQATAEIPTFEFLGFLKVQNGQDMTRGTSCPQL